tara:strand:- start:58 stop:483 length:426 start_codon:yes stop_codon:yes gene_type:complete
MSCIDKKWKISFYCGLLFIVFSSDLLYRNVSEFLKIPFDGCPTYLQMLINSALFGLTLRLFMKGNYDNLDKWRYTYYTWFMFIFLNNPLTYNLVDGFLHNYIDVANGNCPTQLGVYVHAIVFIIMLRFSMNLENKKENKSD